MAALPSSPMRIAVLASGGGSNLQVLLDHFAGPARTCGEIVWVGSDKATAGALARAQAAGIPTGVISAPHDGAALLAMLRAADVQLLVLAGYLKLVPAEVVRAYHGRVLNVHPALLPSFGGAGMYGLRIHTAVLAHGNTVTGVTVHFVDEQYDRGPILAQWPVPVLPGDTPETLATRVLRAEHRLFPLYVAAVARGAVHLGADGRVQYATPADHDATAWRFGLVPEERADTAPDTAAAVDAFSREAARLLPP